MANIVEKDFEKSHCSPLRESAESNLPLTSIYREKTPEERMLVRKLDTRILPITCLMYLFACQSRFFLSSQPLTDSCRFGQDKLGQRSSPRFAKGHSPR